MNKDLFEKANHRLLKDFQDPIHTAAAAYVCDNGEIGTSINTMHYTGFLCAESTALAKAIDSGRKIQKIICVKRSRDTGDIKIVGSCGKCSQLFMDFMPEAKFIVEQNGKMQEIEAEQALPYAYKLRKK